MWGYGASLVISILTKRPDVSRGWVRLGFQREPPVRFQASVVLVFEEDGGRCQ